MGKAYAADSRMARAHVYANGGRGPCPYEVGTRAARLWSKWQAFYTSMESQFDDLALAYGEFRPDRIDQALPTKREYMCQRIMTMEESYPAFLMIQQSLGMITPKGSDPVPAKWRDE